jgi:hypothetical protein
MTLGRATYVHIYIRQGTALRISYKPIIAHTTSNAYRGDTIYRQDTGTRKKQHVQAALVLSCLAD